MFDADDLPTLRYLVAVAVQCIPANHTSAPHAAAMLARVDTALAASRRRNHTSENSCTRTQLERDQYVGTAEAARLLGCSQRRVQQRARSGGLTAELVGRTYLIHRRDLERG